ncbi:MAG: helix-turn-helix transcriptional regulator [Patescibacteria group bacterium]
MVKNKLKVFRAMKNLTQEELADRVGVTRQTIIAIENNKYLPSLELAFKIANFFEVALGEIFIYKKEK